MAYGNPVSFWYGTKAQYDSIGTKLADTLYFITDEQALYKGDVKFSGSGVETLIKVDDGAPTSANKYDRYFNTSDGLIHVLNTDGTDLSTYPPADGALYYDTQLKRFVTLTKNGNSWDVNTLYDAGVSVDTTTGLSITNTVISGVDATYSTKGMVTVGDNITVTNGVISVPLATASTFGVVKIGNNITVASGVISINYATSGQNGVVKLLTSFVASNLPDGSYWVTDSATAYATTLTAVKNFVGAVLDNSTVGLSVDATTGKAQIANASASQKGIVKIGDNINVNNGVISVSIASNASVGLVYVNGGSSASNGVTLTLNTTTGALTVTTAKATASAFGTVQIGTNIDVADGVISVKTGSASQKGIVQIGTNIDVDANGVISVKTSTTSQKGVVQIVDSTSDTSSTDKAVTPHYVSTVAGTKQDNLTAGYRTDLSGNTVSQLRYMDIETVSGATITFLAGHAYKIQATDTKKLVTETIPANKFGLEGHAEIFVTDTGFITTADNVVLVDALEPNAVNNCTLRFHDGMCLISVEDHVAGYIVRTTAASGTGSLNAALIDTSKEYISVDASLNEHTLEFNSATNTVTKHFVGNGVSNTLVEGSVIINADLTLTECTVRPFSVSGTGTFTVTNGVLDFTDATEEEPITTTGGVTIGKDVTVIDGSGNVVGVDPRTYGTVKKDGSTTPANYVYGYAQGLTQGTNNYVPIVLENNIIYKVDARDKSKMSCHERRVVVMDDCATRHINYRVNPSDLTKKLDGTASVLDGTDGDVMTEIMPYYRLEIQLTPQNDTTPRNCVLMSRQPFAYTDGNNVEHVAEYFKPFKISPDGKTVRPQYIGYYLASTDSNSKLRSVSSTDTKYIYPTVSLKLGPTGSEADNKDSLLNRAIANGGSVCNELHYELLYDLFVCDKLTVDTQSVAYGFGNASSTAWSTIYPRACGYTNQVEEFYGGSTYADSRDTDMLPLWSGCAITVNSISWGTSPDGCVWSADATTGKRIVSAYRWRSGTNPNWNYIYTKAADGMPAVGTHTYSDSACTEDTGYTVTANNVGTAATNRQTSCKYFIENPWGTIWQNLAGFLPICTGNNIGYFLTTSINRYKELLKIPISEAGTSRGEADGNAEIEWVSHLFPASGWVTTWNMTTFLPLSIGTQVMKDYFYNSDNANPRAGLRGGLAYLGSFDGLGCVPVYYAVGYASAYTGGRLSA